jgi:hypothetical protein
MDEICEALRQVFQTKNALTFPVSVIGIGLRRASPGSVLASAASDSNSRPGTTLDSLSRKPSLWASGFKLAPWIGY